MMAQRFIVAGLFVDVTHAPLTFDNDRVAEMGAMYGGVLVDGHHDGCLRNLQEGNLLHVTSGVHHRY